MPKALLSLAKWLTLALVLLTLLVWLMLASPLLRSWRIALVEDLLSAQLGHPFVIQGDVRLEPGLSTLIHVSQALIPSSNLPDTTLIRLSLLELTLDIPALIAGRVALDNLVVDGLQVNMITAGDGTTSWIKWADRAFQQERRAAAETPRRDTASPQTPDAGSNRGSILSFLSNKTVSFTNIGLVFDNKANGFIFDFDLESARLVQMQGGRLVSFTGNGTVNGQPFSLEGNYPRGAPFTHKVTFADIVLTYDGTALADGPGYTARLDLDTGEVGDLFDILRLKRSFGGSGTLTAQVTSRPGQLAVSGLDSSFELDKGRRISATGDVDNLLTVDGVDIRLNARLHPSDAPPPNAARFKDIKLTGIDAHVISQGRGVRFQELLFLTNAFEQDLTEIGPVTIGQIYRTPQQTLGLKDLRINIGPRDAPFITAKGDVGDALGFSDIAISGRFDGKASAVLTALPPENADQFGRVTAEFELSDASGQLGLTRLSARSQDTDLWSLDTQMTVEKLTELGGIAIKLALRVADSAQVLAALQAEPIEAGALGIDLDFASQDQTASIDLGFQAAGSDVTTNLSFDLSREINLVRGTILSEKMRLVDIREGTKAAISLSRAHRADRKANTATPEQDTRPPLQPLVIEDRKKGLLSPYRILTETDLEIALDIRQFIGDAGISSMTSKLIADLGKVQAGPMELRYGRGFFKVLAQMDVVNDPDNISIRGGTSGWDFGRILESIGLGIQANGILRADFNVIGKVGPVRTFANSMVGSAALGMGNGMIATSLLELAGLGVFPWLFSQERRRGETEIVCVRAPVRINAGRVTFDQVVAETRSVQLVARGEVDWRRDSIALRAEPRRVGRPLSRSAWPFDVTGKLSDPQFKLQVGGSRSRRADGASDMPGTRTPCVPDIFQLE